MKSATSFTINGLGEVEGVKLERKEKRSGEKGNEVRKKKKGKGEPEEQ